MMKFDGLMISQIQDELLTVTLFLLDLIVQISANSSTLSFKEV